MALVVIEEEITVGGRREGRQPARDGALPFGVLIRVGNRDLASFENPRRSYREFPSVNPRTCNREWKKHVGVANRVVVEIVPGALPEVVHIECPTPERDR